VLEKLLRTGLDVNLPIAAATPPPPPSASAAGAGARAAAAVLGLSEAGAQVVRSYWGADDAPAPTAAAAVAATLLRIGTSSTSTSSSEAGCAAGRSPASWPDESIIHLQGATPLHLAAAAGHADLARWLLTSQRARRGVVDGRGLTPLGAAAGAGAAAVVQVLLEDSPDLGQVDTCGRSVLHMACYSGSLQVRGLCLFPRTHTRCPCTPHATLLLTRPPCLVSQCCFVWKHTTICQRSMPVDYAWLQLYLIPMTPPLMAAGAAAAGICPGSLHARAAGTAAGTHYQWAAAGPLCSAVRGGALVAGAAAAAGLGGGAGGGRPGGLAPLAPRSCTGEWAASTAGSRVVAGTKFGAWLMVGFACLNIDQECRWLERVRAGVFCRWVPWKQVQAYCVCTRHSPPCPCLAS
jgi:hypothetical protein